MFVQVVPGVGFQASARFVDVGQTRLENKEKSYIKCQGEQDVT